MRKNESLYGEHNRFLIRKVEGGFEVYDAEAITDHELFKEGKRAPLIFTDSSLGRAQSRCNDLAAEAYRRRSYE